MEHREDYVEEKVAWIAKIAQEHDYCIEEKDKWDGDSWRYYICVFANKD